MFTSCFGTPQQPEKPAVQGDKVNIGELLSVCIDAAQQAGGIIRKVWKSGELDVQEKTGKNDPLTVADLNSQRLIMSLLYKRYPALKMIGEEAVTPGPIIEFPKLDLITLDKVPQQYQSVPIEDVCVFIDPLDATKEYTEGILEAVMTLIGIGIKGKPVAGVMYQPFVDGEDGNGRTLWGMDGLGSFGYTRKERNDGKLIVATTRSHSDKVVEEGLEKMKPDEVLRVGGAGYKAMLVLENRVDFYFFPTRGTKKWDTCAPEAIIRAVGGDLTDKHGKKYEYFFNTEVANNEGVIASMKDHQKFVEKLNS